jgi:ABC-type multidrug transport system ATPase subunit
VFLDELTTGLDPTARRATWRLVRQVRDRGATVLLVTHFMEEAEALCDRVAIVDQGRVVALDTPAALTAYKGGQVRMTFTMDGHDPRYLADIPGVDSVTIDDGQATVRGRAAQPSQLPPRWRPAGSPRTTTAPTIRPLRTFSWPLPAGAFTKETSHDPGDHLG